MWPHADGAIRNYRNSNGVKHPLRAARSGRTSAKARNHLTERARAIGASPRVTYFFAAL
jgi:hypothetical protein